MDCAHLTRCPFSRVSRCSVSKNYLLLINFNEVALREHAENLYFFFSVELSLRPSKILLLIQALLLRLCAHDFLSEPILMQNDGFIAHYIYQLVFYHYRGEYSLLPFLPFIIDLIYYHSF